MRRRRTRGATGPRVAAGAGGGLQGDRGVGPRTLVESPGLGDARLALPLLLCSITGGADLQGPGVGARVSLLWEKCPGLICRRALSGENDRQTSKRCCLEGSLRRRVARKKWGTKWSEEDTPF